MRPLLTVLVFPVFVLACTGDKQADALDSNSTDQSSSNEASEATSTAASSSRTNSSSSRPAMTGATSTSASSSSSNATQMTQEDTASSTSSSSATEADAGAPSESTASPTTQTSTQDSTSADASGRCADGPLSEPLPDCAPEFEETGDYYADCVARINQLRWECQCLPPLDRHEDGEACADQHAQHDYEVDEAHAGFKAKICEPGGSGQNECPGYGGRFGIVDYCLQQMWDEGPGEDFQAHGHYINMTNPEHASIACGTYTNPEGEIWAVQNFFR